ncbi:MULTISPECIES: hypothetical protein [Methylomonas]|uniref:Uncharacterized protein n=2 Tax=Methylomonas TaxID=416 RepID=A0A126T3M0_9GAMM|nr:MULTISPECIES: hypothetical protein [Methylomonas]AMK76683.1 hypothetical protein JT25_009300 [Methylomonas denitrificans]OAI00066.1 hypothetical protein A1342_18785 [Methylomonas methanica]TCV82826.1 hypothetical protein EDE11_11182 [Methylomonas methanica]
MKLSTVTIALLATLASENVLADDYICKTISGTIQPSTVDPDCNILRFKDRQFPDVTFLGPLPAGAPPVCFAGSLTATLGKNQQLTGTAFSGLIANEVGQLVGASAIKLNAGSVELGRVFTKDLIFNPDGATTEILTMVGGNKVFKGGRGQFEINGNILYQSAPFSGQLCVEDD